MYARIIVASADVEVRRLVTRTLIRRGYDVAETNTGDHAIHLARVARPGLMVLDSRLTCADGMPAVKASTVDPSTALIPLVLMCQPSDFDRISADFASDAVACLVKPFSFLTLASTVGTLLRADRPERTTVTARHTLVDLRPACRNVVH